jgi:hypothetical protein
VDLECLPRLGIYPLAVDIGLLNEERLVFQLRTNLLARRSSSDDKALFTGGIVCPVT